METSQKIPENDLIKKDIKVPKVRLWMLIGIIWGSLLISIILIIMLILNQISVISVNI